jgi:hypothetical protein
MMMHFCTKKNEVRSTDNHIKKMKGTTMKTSGNPMDAPVIEDVIVNSLPPVD